MKGDLQIKFNPEMDWLSRIFEGANREGRYKLKFDEEDIKLSKRTTDTQAYIFYQWDQVSCKCCWCQFTMNNRTLIIWSINAPPANKTRMSSSLAIFSTNSANCNVENNSWSSNLLLLAGIKFAGH
ncbi:hypothetical protein HanPI659440_Chr10g0372221 [Helianthus annuus]|nr:hypothetical protein HanPI659440_Chr10g0372221 [Helianthus annuus]